MAAKLITLALCLALCHAGYISNHSRCPPSYSGYVPHEMEPASYLACHKGAAELRTCREGQVFDLQHQHCVTKTDSDPSADIDKSIPDLGETHPNGCPVDYYITYLTPHPSCSLYYSCVYGEKVEQFCQPGLLFNYRLQACVWPWESDCEEGTTPEPSYPDVPGVPVQPEPESAIPEFEEKHPNGCPVNYDITYLTPHPVCSLYYSCVYGEKVEQFCQPGHLFNYRLQACVWPWESDCGINSGGGSSPGSGAESGNPGSSAGAGSPAHELQSAIPEFDEKHPNGCPVDHYITYLTPHQDCSLYYSCVYGEKVEQYCQPGLLFNYQQQACVWPWESDCEEGTTPEPSNPDVPGVPVQPEPESAIPEFEEKYPNGCPVNYDITYLTPHPFCSLYYSCVYGEKVEQFCQPGLLFNYRLQACVWPWESDCGINSGGGSSSGSGAESGNPGSSAGAGSPAHELQSAIPEFDEKHPNGCPVDHYITYLTPHQDCSLYYSCVYGEKVEQYCQPGLLFNYQQQACVWPWESDCGEGTTPEPSNPDVPGVPIQPEPESAIPEFEEKHPNGCPVDYYITYLTPHPVCSRYYSCVYGEKVDQFCQPGLLFNYWLQRCVWPQESDCASRKQK